MRSKIVKCVDCGKEYPRKELNHNFRCVDCRGPKMAAVMQQLHDHQGPEYERWKARTKAAISSL